MSGEAYERIAGAFYRRIDSIAGAVDSMAPGLEAAAALLTQAVLEDRKILVCGSDEDATLACHIASSFRTPVAPAPALPAIALSCEVPDDRNAWLWRDLRTLARDGDILLCVDSAPGGRLAMPCFDFAQQRNLVAIALSEPVEGGGVCVALPPAEQTGDRSMRTELVLMACHCLQEQIRQFMLGE